MKAVLHLETFEGPLDLLLQLIDKEELNITDVALSKITEQYFSFLDKLERDKSAELADFLVIAAKLVYLKSRTLLPYLYPEAEEDGPNLVDQLKMYKRYIEAAKEINKLWMKNTIAYGRVEPPVKSKEFVLPLNAGLANLHDSLRFLLQRLKPVAPLPRVSIDYSISVKHKIDSIRKVLERNREMSFSQLLESAANRTEIIVSFLAVLDLVQSKQAAIRQNKMFGDLFIKTLKH